MRRSVWKALFLGLMVCGGLVSCSRAPAPAPEPVALRDPSGWISSAVLFDPARFSGRWHVVESGVPGCGGARQDWAWDGQGGWKVSGTDCAGSRPSQLADRIALTGPGARFTPNKSFGGERIWLLWVDQDYRTAVLGTPSGRFGMVIARSSEGRADLMRAAREVLDFNGYDLRRIQR